VSCRGCAASRGELWQNEVRELWRRLVFRRAHRPNPADATKQRPGHASGVVRSTMFGGGFCRLWLDRGVSPCACGVVWGSRAILEVARPARLRSGVVGDLAQPGRGRSSSLELSRQLSLDWHRRVAAPPLCSGVFFLLPCMQVTFLSASSVRRTSLNSAVRLMLVRLSWCGSRLLVWGGVGVRS